MDERLEKAIAGNEKLAKLVSEAEKMGIKIVVADEVEEEPVTPDDMANMVEFMRAPSPQIPVISPSGSAYPSGQENRRKRREMERKNKKGKK
jgi:hypothetical protein